MTAKEKEEKIKELKKEVESCESWVELEKSFNEYSEEVGFWCYQLNRAREELKKVEETEVE